MRKKGKIFEGKNTRIKFILFRGGRARYYKSVGKKAFYSLSIKSALKSIAGIKGYQKRVKALSVQELTGQKVEEEALAVGRWFVGRTSQPAPNGYIIIMGAFSSRVSDSSIYEHVQNVLSISFREMAILNEVPANWTYAYDLEGNNISPKIAMGLDLS